MTLYFTKILIANRGEIAVRVIRACRELGIRTVAVYSEADREALHVRLADEAVLLGPAAASESYLRIHAVVAAARQRGAEAVHPGYGFLAENAAFAEACERAGLVFVGPSASAIRLMGDKVAAKRLAEQAGVPVVPGYLGEDQRPERLLEAARAIGFPLLIKAAAGGGGKGMRAVERAEDFLPALEGARRETRGAFGDDAVFLERLLRHPRHVEFQVLADRHGAAVHLGERECSIQRRHQKILEESPSPALTPERRAAMGEAALRIIRAAAYVNAGTVEFLLDEEGAFYFLEMNTRLQVEHPVTELVMGLDLVHRQIAIAAGRPLELCQEAVSQRGHAVEVRVYAEDPEKGFLPATGRISRLDLPQGPGLRVDSGVEAGDLIGVHYDPLLAKLIVWGENRQEAINRLGRALDEVRVEGVTTNVAFLRALVAHPAFRTGQTHTGFLQEHPIALPTQPELSPELLAGAAIYELARAGLVDAGVGVLQAGNTSGRRGVQQYARTVVSSQFPRSHRGAGLGELTTDHRSLPTGTRDGQPQAPSSPDPWRTGGPWRLARQGLELRYRSAKGVHLVRASALDGAGRRWLLQAGGQELAVEVVSAGPNGFVGLQWGGSTERYRIRETDEPARALEVEWRGQGYRLEKPATAAANHLGRAAGALHEAHTLTAPMPGLVVKLHVRAGDYVKPQQPLAVLEAMKMEHVLAAPYGGLIKRVHFREGDLVPAGASLIEVEEA